MSTAITYAILEINLTQQKRKPIMDDHFIIRPTIANLKLTSRGTVILKTKEDN